MDFNIDRGGESHRNGGQDPKLGGTCGGQDSKLGGASDARGFGARHGAGRYLVRKDRVGSEGWTELQRERLHAARVRQIRLRRSNELA
jgi:hypothetical protein